MKRVIVFLLTAFLAFSWAAYAQEKPDILLFLSSSCHICHKVRAKVLPQLKKKYQGKVNWIMSDIREPDSLRMLQSLSEQFQREKALVPSAVVGDKMFVGFDEIKEGLDQAIQNVLTGSAKLPFFSKQNLLNIFKKFFN